MFEVQFTPEARDQLASIYRYIAHHGSPDAARRYTNAIISDCERLAEAPFRGNRRDDIRPGLRTTHYKGRTIIAFAVDEAKRCVFIVGVFYGGQDYERALGD